MAQTGEPSTVDDGVDWFGEDTPFDSTAELTAALRGIATRAWTVHAPVVRGPVAAPDGTLDPDDPDETPDPHSDFEILDPRPLPAARGTPERPAPALQIEAEASMPALPTWSVRLPGIDPLPPRQPGRSGWSLPNSVRILRRAEELIARLRQEAVIAAFDAASRAMRNQDG